MSETNLVSLIKASDCRVSSVLNKNSREFGKQFLTDDSSETCWSSDQGSPQWVALKWDHEVKVTTIEAIFQGGFCGTRETVIEIWSESNPSWEHIETWPLEDVGSGQTFTFKEPITVLRLRLRFPASTDFFGRIIMYKLDVSGEKT